MSVPISARNDGKYYVYSIGPDVCLTPVGSSVVPVAYSTIAFFDSAEGMSRTVRNNEDADFQINTRPAKCQGHEPGTQKGVAVPGHLSHAVLKWGAPDVFSEGWAVVRDGDPALINRPGRGKTEEKHRPETCQISYS